MKSSCNSILCQRGGDSEKAKGMPPEEQKFERDHQQNPGGDGGYEGVHLEERGEDTHLD